MTGTDTLNALVGPGQPGPAPFIRTEMVDELPRLADMTADDHGRAYIIAGGRADGPLFAYFYPDRYFRVYDNSFDIAEVLRRTEDLF